MVLKVKKLQKNQKGELNKNKNLYNLALEQETKKQTKTEKEQRGIVEALKANVERS